MAELKRWKRLGGRTAFANRWLRVDVDEVELPDGRSYEYTLVRQDKHGAAILAFDAAGQILMQREYRYPVDAVIWQLPGGLIDGGETPLQAAQRELAEETGHVAESWRQLGLFWDNPALDDMLVHIFVAEGAQRAGDGHRDEAEWVQNQWVSAEWLRERVRSGEIKERVILAALGFLWAKEWERAR